MKYRKIEPELEAELESSLQYCPDTGKFTRLKSPKTKRIGKIVGTNNGQGYLCVSFMKRIFKAHRIAWRLYYGVWPDSQIDHINGDRSDNRICNLRLATHKQNTWNRSRSVNSNSGVKGVTKHLNRWQASIGKDGRRHYLGSFKTIEEAKTAREKAEEYLFGEFTRRDQE